MTSTERKILQSFCESEDVNYRKVESIAGELADDMVKTLNRKFLTERELFVILALVSNAIVKRIESGVEMSQITNFA